MITLQNILTGILSSILFIFLIWLYKTYFLKNWHYFTNSLFAYKRIGIVKIFSTRTKAVKYLIPTLLKSSKINILQYKGYSLIDTQNRFETTLYSLVTDSNSRIQEINFLLLNPDNKVYINRRTNELKNKSLPYDNELSQKDIRRSIDIIESVNALGLKLKCILLFLMKN